MDKTIEERVAELELRMTRLETGWSHDANLLSERIRELQKRRDFTNDIEAMRKQCRKTAHRVHVFINHLRGIVQSLKSIKQKVDKRTASGISQRTRVDSRNITRR